MKWSAERIIPTTDWRQVSWPKIVSAVNGRMKKECLRSSSVSCIGIRRTVTSWFGLGESIPSYSIPSSLRWFQTIGSRSRTRSIRARTVLWSENGVNQIPLEYLRLFMEPVHFSRSFLFAAYSSMMKISRIVAPTLKFADEIKAGSMQCNPLTFSLLIFRYRLFYLAKQSLERVWIC